MRIGILTLHDSVNYGAVLQAYALRSYLTALGHEAVVIDRRRNPDLTLRTPPFQPRTFRLFGIFPCEARDGLREACVRIARTEEFLLQNVGLTPCRFCDWRDAPADLGLDLIVVGSDQVWNASNLDPADYLLRNVPGGVPGIAYAASIGMPAFPADQVETFRAGLAGFAAIGVREREAVEAVRALGFAAEHVVDPVLLAGRTAWDGLLAAEPAEPGRVFAYFLMEHLNETASSLARFAHGRCSRVDLFVDWFERKTPQGIGRWLKNRRHAAKLSRTGVDLRLDAGPVEFLRSIAASEVVVSNSYHALMFALLLGKEVRIVLPTHPARRKMNARLREFENLVTGAPLVLPDLAAALSSLESGERISVRTEELSARIAASRDWLVRALGGVAVARGK